MLKAGWCTVQFYAFLQGKIVTQSLKGGNTDEFYAKEGKRKEGLRYTDTGTLAKSRMQVAVHPDVSRLVWKFGRWHHHVDYTGFRKNKLRLDPNASIASGENNYGMKLRKVK